VSPMQCADDDSPWLVCRHCAVEARCDRTTALACVGVRPRDHLRDAHGRTRTRGSVRVRMRPRSRAREAAP